MMNHGAIHGGYIVARLFKEGIRFSIFMRWRNSVLIHCSITIHRSTTIHRGAKNNQNNDANRFNGFREDSYHATFVQQNLRPSHLGDKES